MLNVYAIEQGTYNKYDNGKELTTFSYVYLHGELDDEIGFDIVAIEVDELNNLTESGIYDVNVIKPNGDTVEAKLYFWQVDRVYDFSGNTMKVNRGLIVYSDDTESVEYAKSKFEIRADYL